MQRWVKSLLMTTNARDLPQNIASHIEREFMVPQVAIRVWEVADAFRSEAFAQGVDDDTRAYAEALHTPYVGLNPQNAAMQWLADPASVQSVAVIALRVTRESDHAQSAATQPACGLLVLASPDPQRYHEGMGTAFLERLGDLASAALSHLR